jgi:capsular polysaccharide biosynthesis protein
VHEDPIELQDSWQAVKANVGLIALVAIALTVGTVIVSLLVPPRYEAQATLVLSGSAASGAAEDVGRRLATLQSLATTQPVLQRAATNTPGFTAQQLRDHVTAEASNAASIITITASAPAAPRAAAMANAVARGLIDQLTDVAVGDARQAASRLRDQLRRVSGAAERSLLRQRLAGLAVTQADPPTELSLAAPAPVPARPVSPRPLRNGVIAVFAGVFVGVLLALLRQRLRATQPARRDLTGSQRTAAYGYAGTGRPVPEPSPKSEPPPA